MKVYNLKALNDRGSADYRTYEELKQHYDMNKDHLLNAEAHGIKVKILANYNGYITSMTEGEMILQGWAGEFRIK